MISLKTQTDFCKITEMGDEVNKLNPKIDVCMFLFS